MRGGEEAAGSSGEIGRGEGDEAARKAMEHKGQVRDPAGLVLKTPRHGLQRRRRRAHLLCVASPQAPEDGVPTVAVMEADALSNQCFEGFDPTRPTRWTIVVTDEGFTRIRSRLDRQ